MHLFYELDSCSSGEDILSDITRLAKQAVIEGYDMSTIKSSDMEFVKCAGKVCRVPQTEPGFIWSAEAIRTLTGHGDLYIRLRKSFDVPVPALKSLFNSRVLKGSLHPSSPVEQGEASALRPGMSTSTGSPVVPSFSGTSTGSPVVSSFSGTSTGSPVVPSFSGSSHDAIPPSPVQTSINLTTLSEHNSSGEEESPSAFPEKEKEPTLLSKARLYEIFSSNLCNEGVDEILRLCNKDAEHAFKVLLGGPEISTILQLKRRADLSGHSQKLYVSDEDALVEEALVYYKHPSFDPLFSVRLSYRNQPAIDTGGVTRQFFMDVLLNIAQNGALQLFVGPPQRLRLAYSPQVLPVKKILGMLIGHSLLHEGPGFPYLAPFVYWYIATGSEERALPYVSIEEDLSSVTSSVVIEVSFLFIYKIFCVIYI